MSLIALRANVRLVALAAYSTAALGMYEAALAVAPPTRHRALLYYTKRTLPRRALRALGVRAHIVGDVPISMRPRLVVANHRSALDIGVLISRFACHFVSRSDLADWPVVGRMAQHADTIFVNRDSKHSGATAIRTIRRFLKEGRTVMVFPEGKTFKGDDVRTFLPGAFASAKGLGAEILPVGLAYPHGTEYVGVDFITHLRGVAGRPRTDVMVQIGEPFDAEGSSRDLALTAQQRVQALVLQARGNLERTTTVNPR